MFHTPDIRNYSAWPVLNSHQKYVGTYVFAVKPHPLHPPHVHLTSFTWLILPAAFTVMPTLFIIVNQNWRTEHGMLGMRLYLQMSDEQYTICKFTFKTGSCHAKTNANIGNQKENKPRHSTKRWAHTLNRGYFTATNTGSIKTLQIRVLLRFKPMCQVGF